MGGQRLVPWAANTPMSQILIGHEEKVLYSIIIES